MTFWPSALSAARVRLHLKPYASASCRWTEVPDFATRLAAMRRLGSVPTRDRSWPNGDSPHLVFGVTAVEHDNPCAFTVGRLPELTNAAIWTGRPRDSLFGQGPVRSGSNAFQDHAPSVPVAFQHQEQTSVVYPRLMPDLPCGIVNIQAFAAIAASGGVMFMDNTATVLERYAIHSRKRTIRLVNLPVANPEVELPVLRCSARNGLADGSYEE